MEKIIEWIKKTRDKILEFWNKYTSKQKTVIISVVLAIFFALVLLIYFLNQPVYTQLMTVDTSVAQDIVDALDEASIPNTAEVAKEDKVVISVEQNYIDEATLLIGKNEGFSSEMTWDDAVDNGMTTTRVERQTKMRLALQRDIAQNLSGMDSVKKASVYIKESEDDGTYRSSQVEPSVSVSLELKPEAKMSGDVGKTMALFVANAVGCSTTDKIVIMDTAHNLIFSGESDSTLGGAVKDTDEFASKLRNTIADDLKKTLLRTGSDVVDVGMSGYKFNMDEVEQLKEEYTIPEGRDEGYVREDYTYKSLGESGSGGIPGTDSNGDETDYMIQDGGSSNSETSLIKNKRELDKLTETRKLEVGAVDREASSVAIVLTKNNIIHEETLKEEGKLEDITFDQYAEQNNEPTKIDVPQELFQFVANNTGLAVNKISILAYEQPVFQSEEDTGINYTNYLMIILAVLIAALLVFVVVKGTSPVKVTELEPELSVEDLLASTAEKEALEQIDTDSKSELQILVDNFVEENPEAVALLLRNWLNEDWE